MVEYHLQSTRRNAGCGDSSRARHAMEEGVPKRYEGGAFGRCYRGRMAAVMGSKCRLLDIASSAHLVCVALYRCQWIVCAQLMVIPYIWPLPSACAPSESSQAHNMCEAKLLMRSTWKRSEIEPTGEWEHAVVPRVRGRVKSFRKSARR